MTGLATFLLPVCYTVVLWWFTTGVIMVFYRSQRWLVHTFFIVATCIALASFVGVIATRDIEGTRGVYLAVACGIILWAWQTASYYLGYITGPSAGELPGGEESAPLRSWRLRDRFKLALNASIHHELLAAVTGVLLVALTWGSVNRWAAWIYVALWLMHVSAKLNVFLGVRNFRIDILPSEMHYLDELLPRRPMNLLFPFSVVISGALVLGLIYQGITPGADAAQTAGSFIVATMVTLGLLEHLLLVIPLPVTVWGWSFHFMPSVSENVEPRRIRGAGD